MHPFLPAFTISSSITSDSALVYDDEDSGNDGDKPTKTAELQEELEWYPPPPVNGLAALASPPPTVHVPPTTFPAPSNQFELGMSLSYYDGEGNDETVVYEGVMPDGLTHTIR